MKESLFQFDMVLTQGDDHSWSLRFKDPDSGDPIDISSDEFFYTAKPDSAMDDADDTNAVLTIDPGDVALTASDEGGGVVVDTATFTLAAAATAAVDPGKYQQDIQRKVGGSAVKTIARGTLVVKDQVTIRTS